METTHTVIVKIGNQTIVEGTQGTRLLQSPNDIVDIIGACFENHTRAVLLYAENLTENFFDLSSGDAGAILQKLRNYHMRAAIVAPADEVRQSPMFREMAREESKSNDFRIFEDKIPAETWLTEP
jgi:hypothetical protein